MPDDVIKETNRQIVFYPRILKRRGGKVGLLRKGWMVDMEGKSHLELCSGAAKANVFQYVRRKEGKHRQDI